MPEFETIIQTFSGPKCRIILNRPASMNAFNRKMRLEIRESVRLANENAATRVVVISANGKGFCAGADLAETLPTGQTVEQRINEEYKPILCGITESEKPYIASVQGVAAGIGAALALACDMVIMNEKASLYQAFSAVGLIPDGGMTRHLLQHLGPKRAFKLIAFAEKLSAKECLQYGLINQTVPSAQLEQQTDDLAASLTTRAPLSLRYSKQALREASSLSLSDTISLEGHLQMHTNMSDDHIEGKKAFIEKRPPIWKGR